jgi:hypothetical protein
VAPPEKSPRRDEQETSSAQIVKSEVEVRIHVCMIFNMFSSVCKQDVVAHQNPPEHTLRERQRMAAFGYVFDSPVEGFIDRGVGKLGIPMSDRLHRQVHPQVELRSQMPPGLLKGPHTSDARIEQILP